MLVLKFFSKKIYQKNILKSLKPKPSYWYLVKGVMKN
jgi:hypothetical protein